MASRKRPTRPGQVGSVGVPFSTIGVRGVLDRMQAAEEDVRSRGKIDPKTGKRLPPKNLSMGINALVPSGPDFEVYWVSPTDTYYQGPGLSTCVVAHVFIPNTEVTTDEQDQVEEGVEALSEQFSSVKRWDKSAMGVSYSTIGYTYVMFRNRRGVTSGVYKYGPMPLHVYRTFREFSSKGQGVKRILEPFGYSKTSWPV